MFFIKQLNDVYQLFSDRGYASSIGEMEDMTTNPITSVVDDDGNTGYALVINGHSLVYALQPKLESLFLDVGTQCQLFFFFFFILIFCFPASR